MWIIELLAEPFMQQALLAALMVGFLCGLIGTLVVVKRISFVAGGIAHAAYGGVGLARYLALPVLPVTALYSLAMAVLMSWATRRSRHRTEAVVGVIWAGGMSLGVVLMQYSPGYQGDLGVWLFGSMLLIQPTDLLWLGVLALLASGLFYWFYPLLVAVAFEEDYARARGVATDLFYPLLYALIALTVVLAVRVVGLLLVIALMTIPPLLVEARSQSLAGMAARAVGVSVALCLLGIVLAVLLDWPPGPAIVLPACALYVLERLLSRPHA